MFWKLLLVFGLIAGLAFLIRWILQRNSESRWQKTFDDVDSNATDGSPKESNDIREEVRTALAKFQAEQERGQLITRFVGSLEEGSFGRVLTEAFLNATKDPNWKYVSYRRRFYAHMFESLPGKFVNRSDGFPVATMTLLRVLIGEHNVPVTELPGVHFLRPGESRRSSITVELVQAAALLNKMGEPLEHGMPLQPTKWIELQRRKTAEVEPTRTATEHGGMPAIATKPERPTTADFEVVPRSSSLELDTNSDWLNSQTRH